LIKINQDDISKMCFVEKANPLYHFFIHFVSITFTGFNYVPFFILGYRSAKRLRKANLDHKTEAQKGKVGACGIFGP
jgi:hypothetical protein